MKREIKFRGRIINNKKFVYGSLVIIKGAGSLFYWIKNNELEFKVEPNTVGQFIGLKDKNGVEIYEGDIVKDLKWVYEIPSIFELIKNNNIEELLDNCEVIGNVHDNPELLTN